MLKRFHYISDIHLEKAWKSPPIFADRSTTLNIPLFLAGDIGDPKSRKYGDFIADASERYKRVFLIAGNHEYDFARDASAQISKIAGEFRNVTFLNRSYVEFDQTVIVGCTMWTPATRPDEFELDSNYLKYAQEKFTGKKLFVMTHHLPTYKLVMKKFIKKGCKPERWASHSDELIRSNQIQAWICGHTHITFDARISGVRFLINSKQGSIKECILA